MIQRSSRTTSLLGSSLNSSQLSLYSHASSRSAGDHSRAEGNRFARVSSGGQASRSVSGHGYLTSTKTVSAPRGIQSRTNGVTSGSQAGERRKQERRKLHVHAEESVEGGTDINDDLESYLRMSFVQDKAGGKASNKDGKSSVPRGSELDWDKLLESGHSLNGIQSGDDNVFSDIEDHSDLNGSAFLKKSTKRNTADFHQGPHVEQAKDKLRRTSTISQDIKILDENSSPNVSDLVMTDSLDSISSTHTDRLRQTHTQNLLSDSDRSLKSNVLRDVKEAANLILSNDIDIDTAQSPDRSKPVTMRNDGAILNPTTNVSEEGSISESFDFKQDVISSIDQVEADINEIHCQSEESSFEQNLHNIHSLRELEELEDQPSHTDKGTTKLKTISSKDLTIKMSTSTTKQEQSPDHSPQLKSKLSSFKFSAASTATEDIPDRHKVVSYSSDEFESESVSEVESIAGRNDSEEEIAEESVYSHSDGELAAETVASQSDSDDGGRERHMSGGNSGRQYTELSYSSFSEDEQRDKSELTESQQMEQFASGNDIHPPNTSKEHSTPPKPSTTGASVQQDVSVQTEPLASLPSSQPMFTGYPSVTIGHQYGKEYLNPSPILPHVISPDALEVVTGYSPSVVALTDMLRNQLSITKNLVAHSRQLAASVSNSITPNYHYTTLEETKQYIARHRPKPLCFKEARKLIQLEHQYGDKI